MNDATRTAALKPLLCPHCDDGECLTADGTTHYVCPTCNGSCLVRGDACGGLGAVDDDCGTALCAPCVIVTLASESRERAILDLSALLLRAFALKLGITPRHRPCITPPPPADVPALPSFGRHDRDSQSWRLARENVLETVRPAGGAL